MSYKLFKDRLVVLDIAHHRMRLSVNPVEALACPSACSSLAQSRLGDMVFGPILTTDGFAVANKAIKARIDPLYPGSIIAFDFIEGLSLGHLVATNLTYGGENLLFARLAPVSFAGRPIASAASLMRFEIAYGAVGSGYDSIVGLSILNKL